MVMTFSYLYNTAFMQPLLLLKTLAFILFLYVIINEFFRAAARVPKIKGPWGLLLIGNLAQIRVNAAEQYRKWSKKYGPVYQIQLGNIPVIVVNSAAAARVLFIQNAQALSSRPEFYTFHKVGLFVLFSLLLCRTRLYPLKNQHLTVFRWSGSLQYCRDNHRNVPIQRFSKAT